MSLRVSLSLRSPAGANRARGRGETPRPPAGCSDRHDRDRRGGNFASDGDYPSSAALPVPGSVLHWRCVGRGWLDSGTRPSGGPSVVSVAQQVRAPGCGPGGRGFESRRSPSPECPPTGLRSERFRPIVSPCSMPQVSHVARACCLPPTTAGPSAPPREAGDPPSSATNRGRTGRSGGRPLGERAMQSSGGSTTPGRRPDRPGGVRRRSRPPGGRP